jgi:RNA polymerase sigma-70 factor, ECF subfamily
MNHPEPETHEITEILRQWSEGGERGDAFDKLMPYIYDELHRQAARYLRRERPEHTLQTSALINEAYLKLIDQKPTDWQSRTHFFAFAANAMRQILVDYARAKNRRKRGGDVVQVPLEEALMVASGEKSIDLTELDAALTRLEKIDQRQSRVVELRYFSGLSLEETAEALHISRATAAREWAMARAWLHRELTRQ